MRYYKTDRDGDDVVIEITATKHNDVVIEVIYNKRHRFLGIPYRKNVVLYKDSRSLYSMIDWGDYEFEQLSDEVLAMYNNRLKKNYDYDCVRKKINIK